MSAIQEAGDHAHERPSHGPEIRIDHKPYRAPKHIMTGLELRVLAQPPIGQQDDLWLEHPGPEDDIKVGNDMPIHLKEGMHFYIAPATINPGA